MFLVTPGAQHFFLEFITQLCLAGVLFNPRHHRLMEYLNKLAEVVEPSFSQIVWLLLSNHCYIAFVTIQWLGGIHIPYIYIL